MNFIIRVASITDKNYNSFLCKKWPVLGQQSLVNTRQFGDIYSIRINKRTSIINVVCSDLLFNIKIFEIAIIKLYGTFIQNQLKLDDGAIKIYIIKQEFDILNVDFSSIFEIVNYWFNRIEFTLTILELYENLDAIEI